MQGVIQQRRRLGDLAYGNRIDGSSPKLRRRVGTIQACLQQWGIDRPVFAGLDLFDQVLSRQLFWL